jgi:glycerophosphoryl diester phosphodiesterase
VYVAVDDGIIVMAHRGSMGYFPPNTLIAFEKSITLGVDALETDIQMTSDHVLVVRHDPTIEQTTDGTGKIEDISFEELKSYDAGYRWTNDSKTFPFRDKGITIPSLQELFEAFPNTRINIDIKTANPLAVDLFCELITRYNREESICVGSFHDKQLKDFRRKCPNIATAAGVNETRFFYLFNQFHLSKLYKPHAEVFQIPEYAEKYHLVTPSFVQAAHAHNIQVHVWTVNEINDMQRFIEEQVRGTGA